MEERPAWMDACMHCKRQGHTDCTNALTKIKSKGHIVITSPLG